MVLLAAAVTSAVTTLAYHKVVVGQGVAANDLDYSDFVSLSLTALGLMIAVLGFFVAAAGVIGWATIESKLRDHSITYFRDQMKKGAPLRQEFEKIIEEIGYEGVDKIKAAVPKEDKYTD